MDHRRRVEVILTVPHAASRTDLSAEPVARALLGALAAAGVRAQLILSDTDREVLDDNRWAAVRRRSRLHRALLGALLRRPAPLLLVDVHGYPRNGGHVGWDVAPFAALLFGRRNPPAAPDPAAPGPGAVLDRGNELFRLLRRAAVATNRPPPARAAARAGSNSITEVGILRGVPSVLLEFPFEADGSSAAAVRTAVDVVAPVLAAFVRREPGGWPAGGHP